MSAPALSCRIGGIGLLGSGLPGWAASIPVLSGAVPWQPAEPALPPPSLLSATERRRTSPVVRLALAACAEATEGRDRAALATVFASGNGDGTTVGTILEALATEGGDVSPTQFHNSVHNAAAGYWGIGAHSLQPSVSLGCHDDSWPLGLMQAMAQIALHRRPVLFCAYDAGLPPPLDAARPTGPAFAAALLLRPDEAEGPRLTLRYLAGAGAEAATPRSAVRAALEHGNPAARALPLLEALASRRAARHAWTLLDSGAVEMVLDPC